MHFKRNRPRKQPRHVMDSPDRIYESRRDRMKRKLEAIRAVEDHLQEPMVENSDDELDDDYAAPRLPPSVEEVNDMIAEKYQLADTIQELTIRVDELETELLEAQVVACHYFDECMELRSYVAADNEMLLRHEWLERR